MPCCTAPVSSIQFPCSTPHCSSQKCTQTVAAVAGRCVQAVAGPALLTGLLWSIGNVCSIYAVQLLGLSVGFPLVQCQLVVSTAWALLYYKEAPTSAASTATFAGSTIVIVVGMMLLAVYGS